MSRESDTASPKQNQLSRRRILQIAAAAGIVGTVGYFSIGSAGKVKTIKLSQPMMGTIVNLTVCGTIENNIRTATSACIERMEALSQMMSSFVSDSPMSQLNRDGILNDAPAELIEVFTLSRELSELTGGAFDPTIQPLLSVYKKIKQTGQLPPRNQIDKILKLIDYRNISIDGNTIRYTAPGTQATLGGIAKGYIVDQGIAVLKQNGITDGCIEGGGDLVTIGTRQDGKRWNIGIRNPRSNDLKKMDTIELSNRAIATSGDYMQYFTDDKKTHHIINPATGFSPVNTASSSILAPTLAKADGLATATMVLGPDSAVRLIESLPDCEGYFFDKQLHKYHTSAFFG